MEGNNKYEIKPINVFHHKKKKKKRKARAKKKNPYSKWCPNSKQSVVILCWICYPSTFLKSSEFSCNAVCQRKVTERKTECLTEDLGKNFLNFFSFLSSTQYSYRTSVSFFLSKEVFVVFLHVTNLCRSSGFCCQKEAGNFKGKNSSP